MVPLTMPEDLGDLVARERLAQRPQQRDGPGDGSLEVQVDAVARGGLVEGRAVGGEEGLVGGDDARARGHGRQDERAGRLDAAHHLDDDVGAAGSDAGGIGGDEVGRDAGAGLGSVAHGHRRQDDGRAHPLLEVLGALEQEAGHRCPHRAAAQQGDRQRPRVCCGRHANSSGPGWTSRSTASQVSRAAAANPVGAWRAFTEYSPTRETMGAIPFRRDPPTPSGGSS